MKGDIFRKGSFLLLFLYGKDHGTSPVGSILVMNNSNGGTKSGDRVKISP
ncbi:MAG: hypothetical protein Q4G59_01530 [Planctomycetia bacterium]|nr:hypothetical protein [Planctomycetia bacterium]